MKHHNIQTAAGRRKLAPRGTPYYSRVRKGHSVGFMATALGGIGTWYRKREAQGVREERSLNRDQTTSYEDALAICEALWSEGTTGKQPDINVGAAVERYLKGRGVAGRCR